VADVLAERRRERDELIELARAYAESLAARLPVVAAVVVGSVARGDFNVWSDVDVVIVADELPPRTPDRASLLVSDAPPRVQPVGFTREELGEALRRGNPLAVDAAHHGVVLVGGDELRRLA
jgi:predicted nucleotidyltransferase